MLSVFYTSMAIITGIVPWQKASCLSQEARAEARYGRCPLPCGSFWSQWRYPCKQVDEKHPTVLFTNSTARQYYISKFFNSIVLNT